MDTPKDLKRKTEHDDRTSQSERKRKKKDGKSGNRPKHYPLSERQQLALLMQMTAEENNEQAQTPPPASKKPSGNSGRKDKVNKRNERGETSLHIATIRGELPMIIDLVKQGADVNVQDYAGWTPLHEACNHGFLDIAKFLLEAGAIVNSKGFNDDYPLHDAVMNEHVDLVELLLKHGANPLLANKQGERPLDLTENDEIKQLMQNEILVSDDSDQNDAKSDDKSEKARSESNDKQNNTTSSISRELFKQFDAGNLTSSDSDDSDNLPLIRQRRISMQSKSSTSSNQASERKTSSSGFLETRRIKSDKRRLFSTESSESLESDTRHKLKNVDTDSLKHPISSEDEFFSHSSKSREDRFSSDSLKSATDKKTLSSLKRQTGFLSGTKSGEPDVYDFSPNADDFSNESNAISLKSESKVSNKWESQPKQPSLFSRKTSGQFLSTKGFEYGAKKNRKSSKEVSESDSDASALSKPIHETSEMLFDRIFKSPLKEDDEYSNVESKPIFESNLFQKSPPSFGSSSSTFSASVTDSFTPTSSSSSSKRISENLFSANLLSPSPTVSKETREVTTSQKSARHSDAQSNIFKQIYEKDTGSRSFSIDNASLSTTCEDSSHHISDNSEMAASKTCRAISLDSKEKTKKVAEEAKIQKNDFLDNNAIKKVKAENKDKLSKTLSEPVKKIQAKSTSRDSKPVLTAKKSEKPKLVKPISAKKEQKSEKKLTLVSESKSSFLSDLDKTSLQRQEKIKRKKLVQKKVVKPAPVGNKSDEKKTARKSEVKLIETDSWLGSSSDKTLAERPRKALQRSTKKLSDASTESDKTLAVSVESDLTVKTRPSISSPPPSKLTPLNTNYNVAVEDFAATLHSPLESDGVGCQVPLSAIETSEGNLPHPSTTSQSNLQLSSPSKSVYGEECATLNVSDVSSVAESNPPVIDALANEEHLLSQNVKEESTEELSANDTELTKTSSEQTPIDCKDSSENLGAAKSEDSTDDGLSTAKEEEEEGTTTVKKEPSEQEKMLQLYIEKRLASDKIELSHVEPLQDRIPLHVLNSRQKDPAVDKLNVIEERLAIQKRIVEKRKKIASVIPQAPQLYWEYMTFTGGYLLSGSVDSRLSVPILAPPSSVCLPMVHLFKAHEEKRVRLRVQHAIQRDKLIISCEQEIMRVHSRAARTNQNQQTPFSACAMLMDCEVYTMPRQPNDNETGKTSIRDRFNTRMYLSWLQDVDDKFVKIKAALLARQRHEAEALHAVQKTEWILKYQEVDRSHRTIKPEEINEVYVPKVNIADDFDLLPA